VTFAPADLPDGLVTIHAGHLAIHQNRGEPVAFERIQGLLPSRNRFGGISQFAHGA
jgi:hypothetical protein